MTGAPTITAPPKSTSEKTGENIKSTVIDYFKSAPQGQTKDSASNLLNFFKGSF